MIVGRYLVVSVFSWMFYMHITLEYVSVYFMFQTTLSATQDRGNSPGIDGSCEVPAIVSLRITFYTHVYTLRRKRMVVTFKIQITVEI